MKNDFSQGKMWKNILNQAIPLTIAQAVQVLYNVVNFLLGLLVQKKKFSKPFMILGVSANLAFLFAYKYLDFVLAQIFPFEKFSLGLIAPIGISFFTFKNIEKCHFADKFIGRLDCFDDCSTFN